ncbi:MAG: helix-turn-helix transcriptional regulator [Ruminococcus sp.]|nr:helix-turn-helix transcriptional regulator [Ruminococcus sp.]
MNSYFKNLKKFRENAGLTQSDIAHILQTRQEQYSKYELGKREIPVHHLITLSILYDVSVDELLGLKRRPKKEQK